MLLETLYNIDNFYIYSNITNILKINEEDINNQEYLNIKKNIFLSLYLKNYPNFKKQQLLNTLLSKINTENSLIKLYNNYTNLLNKQERLINNIDHILKKYVDNFLSNNKIDVFNHEFFSILYFFYEKNNIIFNTLYLIFVEKINSINSETIKTIKKKSFIQLMDFLENPLICYKINDYLMFDKKKILNINSDFINYDFFKENNNNFFDFFDFFNFCNKHEFLYAEQETNIDPITDVYNIQLESIEAIEAEDDFDEESMEAEDDEEESMEPEDDEEESMEPENEPYPVVFRFNNLNLNTQLINIDKDSDEKIKITLSNVRSFSQNFLNKIFYKFLKYENIYINLKKKRNNFYNNYIKPLQKKLIEEITYNISNYINYIFINKLYDFFTEKTKNYFKNENEFILNLILNIKLLLSSN